ncbi:hypothetical protein D3C72_1550250 [compost metagenome]
MDKDDLFLHVCEVHDPNQSHRPFHPTTLSRFCHSDACHGSADFVGRKFPSDHNNPAQRELNAEAEPQPLRCLWHLLRRPFLQRLKRAGRGFFDP